jgi:hypothetical protein
MKTMRETKQLASDKPQSLSREGQPRVPRIIKHRVILISHRKS